MFTRALTATTIAVVMAVSGTALGSNANALVADVYEGADGADVDECFGKQHAGQTVWVQTRVGTGAWVKREKLAADGRGCVRTYVYPAELADPGVGEISVRLFGPAARVKYKGKIRKVSAARSSHTTYRVWPDPVSRREPVPHLDAFAAKYGDSVVTLLCENPWGGGGQGTGVAVPATVHPNAENYLPGAGVLIATAGHAIAECRYSDYDDVTVVYKGQSYPGKAWSYSANPDIGTVITTAPVPPATLAKDPNPLFADTSRPQIGDAAVAIGTAGGVISTTTQGVIGGVSDTELNTTVPSGHGASGGPMFNNKGEVIGLVVAGNGSLTVATALPAFCDTVYTAAWCSTPIWP